LHVEVSIFTLLLSVRIFIDKTMDDENLFEINLADSVWRWDFIDFWAQPLSQRGTKPGREKDDKPPAPEKDQ